MLKVLPLNKESNQNYVIIEWKLNEFKIKTN